MAIFEEVLIATKVCNEYTTHWISKDSFLETKQRFIHHTRDETHCDFFLSQSKRIKDKMIINYNNKAVLEAANGHHNKHTSVRQTAYTYPSTFGVLYFLRMSKAPSLT